MLHCLAHPPGSLVQQSRDFDRKKSRHEHPHALSVATRAHSLSTTSRDHPPDHLPNLDTFLPAFLSPLKPGTSMFRGQSEFKGSRRFYEEFCTYVKNTHLPRASTKRGRAEKVFTVTRIARTAADRPIISNGVVAQDVSRVDDQPWKKSRSLRKRNDASLGRVSGEILSDIYTKESRLPLYISSMRVQSRERRLPRRSPGFLRFSVGLFQPPVSSSSENLDHSRQPPPPAILDQAPLHTQTRTSINFPPAIVCEANLFTQRV